MTLPNLVAELDEKHAKANPGFQPGKLQGMLVKTLPNGSSVCTELNEDEMQFISDLLASYDQLKAAALAGSKLAEAWENQTACEVNDDAHHDEKEIALRTYHSAVQPPNHP